MIAVYRTVLRLQLSRGRIAALVAIGLIAMLLSLAVGRGGSDVNKVNAAFDFIDGFCLGLLVPVTALVFASAALGDPAEDGTLVYLWLRPLARWRLALAALAATISVAVPFALVPSVLAAGITRTGRELPLAVLASGAIATAAYCTLFLGLGLLVRRALVWGLAYVLIWEGFVARSGTGAARLSILVYARSLMASIAHHAPPRLGASTAVSIIVPLAVGAAAIGLTTYSLRRADVR